MSTVPTGRLRRWLHRRLEWIWQEHPLADAPVPEGEKAAGELVAIRSMADAALLAAVAPEGQDLRGRSPEERFEHGGVGWIYSDAEGVPSYSIWTFPQAMPIDAVRTGWLPAPPGATYCEDMVVAPAQRGKGIAGIASAHLFHRLREEGFGHVVTRFVPQNERGRRAAAKQGGWAHVAHLSVVNVGPRVSTHVELIDGGGATGAHLAAEMDGKAFYRAGGEPIADRLRRPGR